MQLQSTHQFIMMGCDGFCGGMDDAEVVITVQGSQCSCRWDALNIAALSHLIALQQTLEHICVLSAIQTLNSKPACPSGL